jgi:hypothetical protein
MATTSRATRIVWGMIILSVLRITLGAFGIIGAIRVGQQEVYDVKVYDPSSFLVHEFSFADLPRWVQISLVGMTIHILVFLIGALAIGLGWQWAPKFYLYASGLTLLWNLMRPIFLYGNITSPLYSLAAFTFSWWFFFQPDVRAHFGISEPVPAWARLRYSVRGIPAEIVIAVGLIVLAVAWQIVGTLIVLSTPLHFR